MLRHDGSVLPITALHLLQVSESPILLGGEGSFVSLYDIQTARVLAKERVFQSQAIHGIISKTSDLPEDIAALILVWGGRSIRLVILRIKDHVPDALDRPLSNHLILCDITSIKDWIFDSSFDKTEPISSSSTRIACVTAHNKLLLLDINFPRLSDNRPCLRLQESGSSVRSILYSAHVTWLSADRIVIAAGTVFGEILLWSCFLDTVSNDFEFKKNRVVLHKAFTAHEGSIFGVQVSSRLSSAESGRLQYVLATCSDDRTIRLWDISKDLESESTSTTTTTVEIQSTGFSAPQANTHVRRTEEARCIATAWGHASRIWGVQFLSFSEDFIAIELVSFGEDAKCQQWQSSVNLFNSNVSDSLFKPQVLEPISTHKNHSGKSIWSLSSIHFADNTALVASGGADGRISISLVSGGKIVHRTPTRSQSAFTLTDIDNSLKEDMKLSENRLLGTKPFRTLVDLSNENNLELQAKHEGESGEHEEVGDGKLISSKKTSGKKSKSRPDTFTHYAFISRGVLIATTSSGRALLGDFNASPRTGIEKTPLGQNLWSDKTSFFSLLSENVIQWKKSRVSAQSSSYVTIACCKDLKVAFLAREDGSVFTYNFLNGSLDLLVSHYQKAGHIFVQYLHSRDQVLLLVTRLGRAEAGQYTIQRETIQGAVKVSFHEEIQLPHGFIITSSCYLDYQKVSILGSRAGKTVFSNVSSLEASENGAENCLWAIPTKAEVHVDAIVAIVDMTAISSHDHVLRISRDGTYSILQISKSKSSVSQESFELLHHAYSGSAARLEGGYFDKKSKDLILYGFRGTDFIVFNETKQIEIMSESCGNGNREWAFDPECGILVYTREGILRSARALGPSSLPVKLGGGGREIKALAVQPVPQGCIKASSRLFATGSEDCRIRLFEYKEGSCQCIGVYKRHKTGVQHLDWSKCGNFLFSSGGLDELFVWKIRRIAGFGVGVVCEAGLGSRGGSDIRITGFSITTVSQLHNTDDYLESEFLVTTINSVTDIQVWHYRSKERTIEMQASTNYVASALLTEIFSIIAPGVALLITAASDGVIALWDFSEKPLENSRQVEESRNDIMPIFKSPKAPVVAVLSKNGGAKSMLVEQISPYQWLIMLGGDDGSLKAYILDLMNPESPSLAYVSGCRGHASAVEAIAKIENKKSESGKKEFTFVTTGADQAIEVRHLTLLEVRGRFQSANVGLELLYHVKTDVADTSSLGTITLQGNKSKEEEQVLIIAGVGIETMTVER